MRKVIYAISSSIDGCLSHTIGAPDEEVSEFYAQLLRDVDLLVYGRVTHQIMVPYWPDVAKDPNAEKGDAEFAHFFESCAKLVFSRTLQTVEGKNSRLSHANPADEIRKLKQEPGKNISVGGVNIASQLIQHGLVDEFYFIVQPVLVGAAPHLFEGMTLAKKLQLKLVDCRPFKNSGAVALHYVKP